MWFWKKKSWTSLYYLQRMLIAKVLKLKPMRTNIGWTTSSNWKAMFWCDSTSVEVIRWHGFSSSRNSSPLDTTGKSLNELDLPESEFVLFAWRLLWYEDWMLAIKNFAYLWNISFWSMFVWLSLSDAAKAASASAICSNSTEWNNFAKSLFTEVLFIIPILMFQILSIT